jgi:tRNA(Ile)-lysidine synthase
MRNIETHIKAFLQPYHNQRIALACSGGIDSMVLLNALIKSNLRPTVLHVNYHLRGEDSDLDAIFIKSYCSEHGLDYFDLNKDLKSHLKTYGGNLQQEARNVRYDFFDAFDDGNTKILLAHHADDQIETFFLNLARGGGMMGLSCMLEKNDRYLRPLLPFFKKEIHAYALNENLKWREDVSNEKLDYSRNKLRNVFIPEMETYHPNLKRDVLYLIEKFQENQSALELKIKPIFDALLKTKILEFQIFDFLSHDEIHELLRMFDIKPSYVSRLSELRKKENGKFLKLSVSGSNGKIQKIFRENGAFRFVLKDDETEITNQLVIEKNVQLPKSFDKQVIYLNPEKITGELKLRKWVDGDRIKPIGLSGSKLVSDILKDAKVPLAFRENQWVVHDDKNLLWLVGYAVSREALANDITPVWKVRIDTK